MPRLNQTARIMDATARELGRAVFDHHQPRFDGIEALLERARVRIERNLRAPEFHEGEMR